MNRTKSTTKPVVSVVIPSYNRAKYLPSTVKTVLAQTLQNIEVIVVDDGSKDDTPKIMQSMCKEHDRLRYKRYERNQGANFARNLGVKLAKSEIVAFNDSDDKWLPNKLELQYQVMDKEGSDYCFCRMERMDTKGNLLLIPPEEEYTQPQLARQLISKNVIGTPLLMIRKHVLQEVGGFDEDFPRYQDWDLVLRMVNDYKFSYVNKVLLKSPYTPDSITSSMNRRIVALGMILQKHHSDFSKYPISLAKHRIKLLLLKIIYKVIQVFK